MFKIKCPVNGCDGYETTTSNSNLLNHIKGHAKTELFNKELFNEKKTPHLDYIKENCQIIKISRDKIILKYI